MTNLRVNADGSIAGLWVIGYHGRLGADQTPAERGVGFVDDEGFLVRMLPYSGNGEVTVERISEEPLAPDVLLPGYGTRVGPWPARMNYHCLILGEPDRMHARVEFARGVNEEAPRVRQVIAWLAGPDHRFETLNVTRIGDLSVWYCSPDEAACLRSRLAPHDRAHLLEMVRHGSDMDVKDAALRLSRVALHDADIYLAVAALQRIAYPSWNLVLDAGVAETRANEREAHLRAARESLPERIHNAMKAPRPPIHKARDRVRGRAA